MNRRAAAAGSVAMGGRNQKKCNTKPKRRIVSKICGMTDCGVRISVKTFEVTYIPTSNASQGQVLDNQQLSDLPNLGRNPFMLSRVEQNVMPVGDPAYNRMEDQSGSSQISIAGGPVRGNNYLLDGVPITDADNRAIIIPSIEAVQEVKVQADTYDAAMARTGGGMFNTFLKSGSNSYHGVL